MEPLLKTSLYRLGVAVSTASMLIGGIPVQAFAATEKSETAAVSANAAPAGSENPTTAKEQVPWYDEIDEMLAAGSYAGDDDTDENMGEIVVTYCGDLTLGDETSNGSDLPEVEIELIHETTAAAYEEASDNTVSKTTLENARTRLNVTDGIVTKDDVNVGVYLVTCKTQSTAELLQRLKASNNPCVIDACPNYEYILADTKDPEATAMDAIEGREADAEAENTATGAGNAGAVQDDGGASSIAVSDSDNGEDAGNKGQGVTNVSDADPSNELTASANTLSSTAAVSTFDPAKPTDVTKTASATGYQWAYNDESLFNTLQSIGDATWSTGMQNSTGIVAVVDSGIDYTHPDLAGAMYSVPQSVRTATVDGTTVGGGAYGFNALYASNSSRNTDPMDDNGHGTHVAGIIAGQTNGYGVSGVSNGAKILAVKAANSNGLLTTASVTAAYSYLERLAGTGLVDLRIVNNSWTPENYVLDDTIQTCVSELSYTYGVASVFASGNNAVDLDSEVGPSPVVTNGGQIHVNALNTDGTASYFSNYGKTLTNVFAPGSAIMSTSLTERTLYMPDTMGGVSYSTFSGDHDSLVTETEAGDTLKTQIDTSTSFDKSGGSMLITGGELQKATSSGSILTGARTRVVVRIPVDESKLDSIGEIGCSLKLSGMSTTAWLEIETTKGWAHSSTSHVILPEDTWNSVSLDLYKSCSGKVKIFRDTSGSAYINAAISSDALSKDFANATLRIDTVGLGNTCWSYSFMSGTSMAAPLVSGLLANIAYRMDQLDGSYSKLHKSVRAQKLVGVLWKSTRKLDGLSDLCSSGGTVDASKIDAAIAADKETVYTGLFDLEVDPDTDDYAWYTIHGSGFGSKQGQLFVNTNGSSPVVSDLTWTDTEIRYRAPRIQGHFDTDAEIKTFTGTKFAAGTLCALDTGSKESGGKTDKKDDSGKQNDNGNGSKPNTDGNNTPNAKKRISSAKATSRKVDLATTGSATSLTVTALISGALAAFALAAHIGRRQEGL